MGTGKSRNDDGNVVEVYLAVERQDRLVGLGLVVVEIHPHHMAANAALRIDFVDSELHALAFLQTDRGARAGLRQDACDGDVLCDGRRRQRAKQHSDATNQAERDALHDVPLISRGHLRRQRRFYW